MRLALDGDSQINFARRIVCNPANENGDSHVDSAGYIAIQVRWALGGGR
jgi:hypothetical protein